MTYPRPSERYREVVCTAGITDNLEWVRLYPIDYRYRPHHQRFRKYQWIDVDLWPWGSGNDDRRESRRPELQTMRVLGKPLPASGGWHARRDIVDGMPHSTLSGLKARYEKDRTSLGILRPAEVVDLKIRPAAQARWKPEWRARYAQIPLFGERLKPLRKIPYEFRYVFRCESKGSTHEALIIDWELGTLFLRESERRASEKLAAESVRQKFLEQMCAADRDPRFFVGTAFPHNSWLVLGVFWPPKERAHQRALPF